MNVDDRKDIYWHRHARNAGGDELASATGSTAGAATPLINLAVHDPVDGGDYTFIIAPAIDAGIRQQWLAVLNNAANPTLFQHVAWQQAMQSHRFEPAAGEPLIVIARQAGNPVAALCLAWRRERRCGMPIRVIELLYHNDMGVRDILIRDGIDGDRLLQALLQRGLPDAGYRWDLLQLPDIAANSTAHTVFHGRHYHRKLAVYHHDSNRLLCGGSASEPFEHVSKSHIKKTRRKLKNLEKIGTISYELITGHAELQAALDIFIEIEDAGWKGTHGRQTSLRHDHAQQAFYRTLLQDPQLSCLIAVMRLEGRPVAVKVCALCGDTLWMLKIAYDNSLHEHSPGNVLLLHLLEHYAGNSTVRYLSFITGGDWTWRWHPEKIWVYSAALFNNTPTGLAIYAIGHCKQLLRKIKHRMKKASKEEDVHLTE